MKVHIFDQLLIKNHFLWSKGYYAATIRSENASIRQKSLKSGLLSLVSKATRAYLVKMLMYLKGRNFRGKQISRISRNLAKVARINSFFDPRKFLFAKINSREIIQNWWFAKINSREIFQELIKCKYWSLLQTIGYFVNCLSKKVSIFTEIALKTIN